MGPTRLFRPLLASIMVRIGFLMLNDLIAGFEASQCGSWGSLTTKPFGVAAGSDGKVHVATENGLVECDLSGVCVESGYPACEDVSVRDGVVHLITRHSPHRAQTCTGASDCVNIGGAERWEWPTAVAAAAGGGVFVADAYHGFKKCTTTWCSNLTMHGYGSHVNLAVDPTGDLWAVQQFGTTGVFRCGSDNICQAADGFSEFGSDLEPSAIAIDGGRVFIGGTDGWVKQCSMAGLCVDVMSGNVPVNGLAVTSDGALLVSAGALQRCSSSDLPNFVV